MLVSGASVPTGLPGIIPTVTAAAEDAIAEDHIIDLAELANYLSGSTTCPTGIIASYGKNIGGGIYNSVIELTIKESGTYKLTGANTTDVKIYAASGVTADIVCDNAYIKSKNGKCSIIIDGEESSSFALQATDYIYPFTTNYDATINLSGKLVVDTYSALNITNGEEFRSDFIAPITDYSSHVSGAFTEIYSCTNGQEDPAFYLNGAEYDASDYAGDCLCIKVNGNAVGVYTLTAGTDSIPQLYYYDDHSFGSDSDVCEHCGVEFVRYTVTINDGSETFATERVIEGRAVAEPSSDPTAPVGKQFCGWYADEEWQTSTATEK